MELLLFGGTSEGRLLAQQLARRGCTVTVCVATEYGAALIRSGEHLRTVPGRLDQAGMAELMASRPFDCVVDATHPYAVEVTANIAAAAGTVGLSCYRLVRDGDVTGDWLEVESMAQAAARVLDLPGNILLTTGSKELDAFTHPALVRRCYPRVLPTLESLGRCLDLGYPQANILCMQGPFSQALNAALMEQYHIKVLVTKASGGAGGFWEKEAAARAAGAALVVVARPMHEKGLTLTQLTARLEARLKGETA